MKLTKEEALRLHRAMWSDMQRELGDNPSPSERLDYKGEWCEKHFPNEYILTIVFAVSITNSLIIRYLHIANIVRLHGLRSVMITNCLVVDEHLTAKVVSIIITTLLLRFLKSWRYRKGN